MNNYTTNKKIQINLTNKLDNLINKLSNHLDNQSNQVVQTLLEIKSGIADINKHIDHGPKPLFGYIDKNKTIPYVKLEYVMNKLCAKFKTNSHSLRKSSIWRNIKTKLKKEYKLEHRWKHVANVSGVMAIYPNISKTRMDDILKEILIDLKNKTK